MFKRGGAIPIKNTKNTVTACNVMNPFGLTYV
mgnify:CR=1 FL=1